jgi:hypothetical protein
MGGMSRSELASGSRRYVSSRYDALDSRDDYHQQRHDHDIAGCRGLQPAHGEIGLEAIIQGETDERRDFQDACAWHLEFGISLKPYLAGG